MSYYEAKNGEARSAKPRLELGTLKDSELKNSNPESDTGRDNRTLNDIYPLISDDRDTGNGWYTKVMTFNSGDVETIALRLESDQSIRKGGGAKRESTSKQEMDESVLRKSQQRAKKSVRHKAMMINCDRMLTLTYRENMTDLNRGWLDLKQFVKKMKAVFEDFAYIAVPEYQERGAVHFHLAVSGFMHANTVRKLWREVVGEGNIDITSPKKVDKASWNPRRIAQYLAKYMSKLDSVDFNRKRYSASRNIPKPPSITGWLPVSVNLTIDMILSSLISKLTNIPFRDYFASKDAYFPFVIVTT